MKTDTAAAAAAAATSTLETRLARWFDARFGTLCPPSPQRILCKAMEELGEVARAMEDCDHKQAREECADVAIVLHHLCRVLGSKLSVEVDRKVAIIEERLRRQQ